MYGRIQYGTIEWNDTMTYYWQRKDTISKIDFIKQVYKLENIRRDPTLGWEELYYDEMALLPDIHQFQKELHKDLTNTKELLIIEATTSSDIIFMETADEYIIRYWFTLPRPRFLDYDL